MKLEQWRTYPHFEGVRVSDRGRVKSRWRFTTPGYGGGAGWWILGESWKYLPLRKSKSGYLVVHVRGKRLRLHVVLLESFVCLRPTIDGESAVARHLNDDKLDNRLENLAWGSGTDNRRDSVRNGTHHHGSGHYATHLSDADVMEMRRLYSQGEMLQREIAGKFDVSRATVCMVINGKVWKHLPVLGCPPKGSLAKKED